MSAAVRAALAAKRAEHRSRSSSPSKPNPPLPNGDQAHPHFGRDLDATIATPFGSPKPTTKAAAATASIDSASTAPTLNLNQKSVEDIVRLSIQNGKANLSCRSPSLQEVPALLFSLLEDEPPSWFFQIPEDDRQPWYMREELHTLQLSNNEIQSLSDEIAGFRGLKRLELHANRLSSLPPSLFQLDALSTLTLSKNGLTSFPTCLLALDNLITLDLSHNRIQALWKEDDVSSARSEREAWEKQNAVQENGVWAGLSPSKKPRNLDADIGETQRNVPLRSLKLLDLSHNRISNAALGIPDLANRRSRNADPDVSANTLIRLPNGLKTLNLGYNNIRGPISVSLFRHLSFLEHLGLQGCGISDDVLAVEKSSIASKPVLSNLLLLDLSNCELDSLDKVEALFGSRRIQSLDQALGKADSAPSKQDSIDPPQGMPARQLVRVLNRPDSADLDRMEDRCNAKILCLMLEGNPLREEAFRQKRGGRAISSPDKKAVTPSAPTTTGPSSTRASITKSPAPAAPAAPGVSSPTVSGASQLPPKPAVVKEDWEILAEAGLNTELGRRKLRIEQARREQEAAAALAAAKAAVPVSPDDAQSRGRKPHTVDDAIASDADGAGSGAESRERTTSQNRGELSDDKDSGSALANAKLSSKKKEALGQVPCKFFRSNGCSAGASCPFAHTLPGDGGQKSVCQWFLKGNCRFGHKCALAHVLPGQPMSMDRKNKRAAQHGQPLPQVPNQQQMAGVHVGAQPSQHHLMQPPTQLKQGQTPNAAQRQVSGQQFQHQAQAQPQGQPGSQHPPSVSQGTPARNTLVPSQAISQVPSQMRDRKPSFSMRDYDLPFGLPDDLQTSAPSTADPGRAGFGGVTSFSESVEDQSPSMTFAGSASLRRPSTLSQSLSASLAAQSFGGIDSAAAAFGTSASASRAFGTSPFSHPSGHALFFSGSQDSEGGAGSFARNNRDVFGARSVGRLDNAANLWGGIHTGPSATQPIGGNQTEEIEDAEDFLPSSLSDLLTPAELERRKRSNRLSSSFAANDERITVAQSMPSHAAHAFGSSLGFGRSAIGAERARASNLSTGFHQQQQLQQQRQPQQQQSQQVTGDDFSPFSDDSRAIAHHAPGQSLPQGLAAGLSRLHLRTSHAVEAGTNSATGALRSIGATAGTGAGNEMVPTSSTSVGGGMFGASSFSQSSQPNGVGGSGLRAASSLDDYGLGPTAPSSVIPHRSPLVFAVGSSSGAGAGAPGSNRLSGSFAERPLSNGAFGSPGSVGGSPFSPPLSAIGSHRNTGTGEGGIAIPEGGAQKHASAMGASRYVQHPATQRLRAGSSTAAPHSPLTLPVMTAEEDEEEAIFELE